MATDQGTPQDYSISVPLPTAVSGQDVSPLAKEFWQPAAIFSGTRAPAALGGLQDYAGVLLGQQAAVLHRDRLILLRHGQ